MTEEKQIEEMRKEVARIHRIFLEDEDYEIFIADMLFKKGYRKQSEGEWEQQPRPYEDEIMCSVCGAKMKGGE